MGRKAMHKGKGFFGETIYYDKNYNEIGRMAKGFIGYNVYNKDLNIVGHATDNFWGGKDYYDKDYNKIGSENRALLMGHNQYDVDHNKIGHSGPNLFGGENLYGNHPVNNLLDEKESAADIVAENLMFYEEPELKVAGSREQNGGSKANDANNINYSQGLSDNYSTVAHEHKSFYEAHPILFSLLFVMLLFFLFFLISVI